MSRTTTSKRAEASVPERKTASKRKISNEEAIGEENLVESRPKKQKTAAAAAKGNKTSAAKVAPKKAAAKKAETKVPAAKKTVGAKKAAEKKAAEKKAESVIPAPAVAPVETSEGDKENVIPNGNKRRGASTVSALTAASEALTEQSANVPAAKMAKPAASKVRKAAKAVKKPAAKHAVKINEAPNKPLDVFVFGEGSSGELGLGSVKVDGKRPIDVKRPRLNANLLAGKVGVVQIAVGGMHAMALTNDNKILTWGVNDQGALGRDTTWDGGLRDASAEGSEDSDDDDSDSGINPKESTPAEIDTSDVVEGTNFVQVAASDSASFALTEDGRVYGWGTFRASDGILGFSKDVLIQSTPVLLPEPKKVTHLVAGSNHVMVLDHKGKIWTWGCPEQNQLGRRCVQRDVKESALRPGGIGFKRGVHIHKIACGSYHSFALDTKGQVYAWGLNNFAELALETGAGKSDAAVLEATFVDALSEYNIVDICGGEHHSVACTDDGKLITWGRIDGHQVGHAEETFTPENTIYDDKAQPRILKVPTIVPGVSNIVSVSAGTDNSFALTEDGKVYSWGFSANYQTGQGTLDDIVTPTIIDNTAIRGKKITFAGAGGQFSVLACEAGDVQMANGV